jgi:hypothetical protein
MVFKVFNYERRSKLCNFLRPNLFCSGCPDCHAPTSSATQGAGSTRGVKKREERVWGMTRMDRGARQREHAQSRSLNSRRGGLGENCLRIEASECRTDVWARETQNVL